MAKKNRNRTKHDYNKYSNNFAGTQIPMDDERYYGIHRDGARAKIDIKRLKKVKVSGIDDSVLDAASAIPRNTTYFLPKKLHRHDYVINQFRDKLAELTANWFEFKNAFSAGIQSPRAVGEQVTLHNLNMGYQDLEEATVSGHLAAARRENVYRKLWISQCAQFIHQMATELDALLLRKCVYLGFQEKEVTRGKMHTYLNGTMRGKAQIERLSGYDVYTKFFMVWNMLKHNSEDLFEKVSKNYPDMLLTDTYRNGEMSQYYMKIGDEYIEAMLKDLLIFYESLCSEFFGEDTEVAAWNYDDFFTEAVKRVIEENSNPLGI